MQPRLKAAEMAMAMAMATDVADAQTIAKTLMTTTGHQTAMTKAHL
jgi:hypothetical protein